jgi:biopolymer transport protein ExbD
MRIRVKSSRRRLERITINLASMIDVTFLLLFFFMVATALEDRETRLSAAVQTRREGGPTAAADFQTQQVEVKVIDGAPAYQLGGRVCRTRAELSAALAALPTDAGMFVRVTGGVPVGFAVAAMQAVNDAGFTQVTYVPE